MTAAELTAARKALGFNTAAALARALQIGGRDPGRTVKRWEAGDTIPGPARVAIGYMLAEKAREGRKQAAQPTTPPDPVPPVLDAPTAFEYGKMQPKARRRG